MPIYRGSGGSGNSNTSANANQVAIDAAAAAQSATNAAASAAAALVSENEAESAETNAETSETNASTSASNAATSETNAATQATNAATSATNAGTSETNAATSASNASTSETNAASSASSASTSETNAASSESTATTKAAEASTSATNASNSATASANSATASANSATASANSAAAAQAAQEAIDGLYLGAQASDPTLDLNGDPVTVGDWYFNTTINKSKIYNGSGWDVLTANGSVTSVTGTGTVNGVTLTGTVTAAGNLTLGGTLSGITASQLNSQNISQWTNDSGYLTSYAETDTLDSVTDRGATTTNAVTVGNLTSTGIDDNATSTAITIDSDERVGINITPTNRTFEVKSIGGAQIIASFETGSSITGRIAIADANTTADNSVGIGSSGNNLDFYAGAAAKATLSSAGNLSVTGNLTSLGIDDNATSTAVTINSAGNVGIGTGATVSAPLHVGKATSGTYSIFDDGTNGRFTFAAVTGGTNENRIFSTTTGFGGYEDLNIVGDNLLFSTGGPTGLKMKINSSGNVGIGTIDPQTLLDLSSATTSTLRISNSDTVLTQGQITGQIEFYQADSTVNGTGITGKIGMKSVPIKPSGGSYYGNAADMGFYVSGNNNGLASDNATLEAMTIAAAGNIGIGSDSPSNRLVVSDGLDGLEFRTNLTDDNRILSYNRGTTAYTKMSFDAADYDFRITGGVPSLTIDNAGDATFTETVTAGAIYAGSNVVAGNGSGSTALTTNDGGGNANLTFNHLSRVPDVTGNSMRIECNVDSTASAYMNFEGLSGTTAGTAVNLNDMARMYADSGDFHANGNVIAYSTSISDERLKENVEQVTGALDMLDQIRGVTFDRKDTGKKSAGVIAQELEKVMPYAIYETALPLKTGSEDDVYKLVEYDALHAVLIEAIKELRAEVEGLKNAASV